MLRIAVCEDEPHLLDWTTRLLHDDLAGRGVAATVDTYMVGEKLLLSDVEYDVILMDIGLDGMSGIDVAKRIYERDKRVAFIFITSHKGYARDAFEVDAVHYLVKPITATDLSEGIDRALRRIGFEDNGGLMITKGNTRRTILFRDIRSCEVMDHTIILQLEREKVEYYGKLDDLAAQLDERFFRCHRSAIVNLAFVERLEEDAVVLPGGVRVPLARRKRGELAARMLDWLRGEGLS